MLPTFRETTDSYTPNASIIIIIIITIIYIYRERESDSAVGIETRYGLGGPGIESR